MCFNPLEIGSSVLIYDVDGDTFVYKESFNPLEIGSSVLIRKSLTRQYSTPGPWCFNPLEIGSSVLMRRILTELDRSMAHSVSIP